MRRILHVRTGCSRETYREHACRARRWRVEAWLGYGPSVHCQSRAVHSEYCMLFVLLCLVLYVEEAIQPHGRGQTSICMRDCVRESVCRKDTHIVYNPEYILGIVSPRMLNRRCECVRVLDPR